MIVFIFMYVYVIFTVIRKLHVRIITNVAKYSSEGFNEFVFQLKQLYLRMK